MFPSLARRAPPKYPDYTEGVWTPTWTNLTVVGAPTYTGSYTRTGKLVVFEVKITAGGAITTASTYQTTFINNVPLTPGGGPFFWQCFVVDETTAVLSNGITYNSGVFTPTWVATNANKHISGWYEI